VPRKQNQFERECEFCENRGAHCVGTTKRNFSLNIGLSAQEEAAEKEVNKDPIQKGELLEVQKNLVPVNLVRVNNHHVLALIYLRRKGEEVSFPQQKGHVVAKTQRYGRFGKNQQFLDLMTGSLRSPSTESKSHTPLKKRQRLTRARGLPGARESRGEGGKKAQFEGMQKRIW